jgi:hypothetical protein
MSTRSSKRARRLAAAVAGLTLAAVAAPALGAGDYGPDTCLNGYVWREAIPADHVCVTPLVRMQTAQENDLAGAHRSPTGGPYGPDTCLSGYVWREAYPGDHVCVLSPRRQQARTDNAHAAERRNSLRVRIAYYRPAQPPCTDDPCTQHSDDAQRMRVLADRINVGMATVVLHRTDTGRERRWRVLVRQNPGGPGGVLSFASGMLRCNGTANAYFAVRDALSTRWSSRAPVRTGCSTL